MVEGAKAKRVHHTDRAGSHRNNVANNAAYSRGSSLEGFNEAWVVVAFDFERDGPAFTNIHHTGVLTHSHHEVFLHGFGEFFTELSEVRFGAFIGAVF
ncbi:MAG: Uncharacterised protein [Cellulomonadaceae bacterium TMED98]|nr:MAG: Uncharacterised protein [Cellulomonadaceae bacterium TMED98]